MTQFTADRPVSAPPLPAAPHARGLIRLICTSNPFYVLSAGLFLAGLWMSFGAQADEVETYALMSGLAGYTLLLAATAFLLVRFARVWDDARTVLLLVALMFLATSVTFDEVLVLDPARGYACYLLGLAFAVACPALRPLVVLEMPVRDLYGPHWSITGEGVPGADTPDEAVYLPGRNVLFLSKALLWCHLNGVSSVALGTLAGNPFPDATPAFFDAFAHLVSMAINGNVRVLSPYQQLSKREVMLRGRGLPLDLTFSCIRPVNGIHCCRCNKCAERRHAFADAGMPDPTRYDG